MKATGASAGPLRAPGSVRAFIVAAACGIAGSAWGQQGCGDLMNGFGPYDYRSATEAQRSLVESAHFTPQVESLASGESQARAAGDIDYTLRAFPNHPRALLAMVKVAEREKTDKPVGSRYTVECWFDRAIRFQPQDGRVRMLFGFYLIRRGKPDEAVKQLEEARALSGEDANVHYNLGLAYAELNLYDKALAHAHEAYRLGFPLPGLRKKLERAGAWRDPAPAN